MSVYVPDPPTICRSQFMTGLSVCFLAPTEVRILSRLRLIIRQFHEGAAGLLRNSYESSLAQEVS